MEAFDRELEEITEQTDRAAMQAAERHYPELVGNLKAAFAEAGACRGPASLHNLEVFLIASMRHLHREERAKQKAIWEGWEEAKAAAAATDQGDQSPQGSPTQHEI